jgi:hypothetical protein
VTPDDAAEILVRLEGGWPSEPWRTSSIDLWYGLLIELDYPDTYEAVTELIKTSEHRPPFAVVRSTVEHRTRRRNQTPPARPCVRCNTTPAELNRTRCGPCQQIVDDETARGVAMPAMVEAVRAAHRRLGNGGAGDVVADATT